MRLSTLLTLCLFLTASLAAQSVPSLVNYQGRLTDATGTPMAGTKMIEVRIYTAPTGGTEVWGPQVFDGVQLVNGEFNIVLSQDTFGAPVTEAFSSADAYLGLRVGDAGGPVGSELQPRQQFLAVPFALRSLDADSADAQELLDRLQTLEDAVFPPGSATMVRYFQGTDVRIRPRAVALDSSNNVIIGGGKNDAPIDFGDGPTSSEFGQGFLVKYDSSGAHVWSKLFASPQVSQDSLYVSAIDVDDEDNIFASGLYNGPIDFGSGAMGEAEERGTFLVKLAPDGSPLWTEIFPFVNFQGLSASSVVLRVDQAGNPVMATTFSGNLQIGDAFLINVGRGDILLAKFDGADGSPVWARSYGSSQDEEITGIDFFPNNDIAISGNYQASMQVGPIQLPHHGIVSNSYYDRLFVGRISAAGSPVWAKGFAPQSARLTSRDAAGGVVVDADQNLWTSGYWVGDRDFGGGATGTGVTSNLGYIGFDSSGEWIHNQFWPAFQRDPNFLVRNGEKLIHSSYLSTNSTVNFGGAALASGFLFLSMERTFSGISHDWSSSFTTGNFDTNRVRDMATRGSRLAAVGTFTQTTDFGTGPVTSAVGETYGFLVILRP